MIVTCPLCGENFDLGYINDMSTPCPKCGKPYNKKEKNGGLEK